MNVVKQAVRKEYELRLVRLCQLGIFLITFNVCQKGGLGKDVLTNEVTETLRCRDKLRIPKRELLYIMAIFALF